MVIYSHPFFRHPLIVKKTAIPRKCENNRLQQSSIVFYHSIICFAHQNERHQLIYSTGSYMRGQGPWQEMPERQWL